MIKSIYNNEDELLMNMFKLHNEDTGPMLDPTYSTGRFYRNLPEKYHPAIKSDLYPPKDLPEVYEADCRALSFTDESICSIMFDPPFLATKGPSLKVNDESNKMVKRFGNLETEKELFELYSDSLKEFYRLLCPICGVLFFKCQDKVSSGKQYFSHILIYDMAIELGFYAKDLFVLEAQNRLVANWQRNQQHARKFHSYYWVFTKNKKLNNFQKSL